MKDEYIKRSDVLELSRIYFSPDLWEEAVPVKAIRNIPSADVQPVVHGKWERRECGLDIECKCSACGYRDFVPYHDNYWVERNFCPNCGARMDGGT